MHKRNNVAIILGVMLLLAAIGLSGFNLWEAQRGAKASQDALDVIEQTVYQPTEEEQQSEPLYKAYPNISMPVVDINGYGYIGYLDLPTLGMRLPIMAQWSEGGLHVAPGRYKGSAYSNDLIIAGHNYYSHFGPLTRLKIGDSLSFTDMDGNVFVYTVQEMESIVGTDLDAMEVGNWDLSLFTCDMSGRNRFTVRCALAK